MKSHPCAKTGGGVPPSSDPISRSITPCHPVTSTPATIPTHATTLIRCRHIDRLGRHCRLFSTIPDLELCPHHARQTQNRKQRHHDKSAAELLGDLENFSTPEAINFLLGNLVRQLARKRIHRRDAMAIAYVCQLLLGSISSMDRHEAAQRTSADLDEIPPRLVFDPPDEIDAPLAPISDTLKLAASLGVTLTPDPQNKEGRA
jgi:hypothetical protein